MYPAQFFLAAPGATPDISATTTYHGGTTFDQGAESAIVRPYDCFTLPYVVLTDDILPLRSGHTMPARAISRQSGSTRMVLLILEPSLECQLLLLPTTTVGL